jgi:hypothetical protein
VVAYSANSLTFSMASVVMWVREGELRDDGNAGGGRGAGQWQSCVEAKGRELGSGLGARRPGGVLRSGEPEQCASGASGKGQA